MPNKKTKLTKKKDTTVVKTEIHVKSYDRKPFKVKKKKVNPKRTKSHNRLIASIKKLNKDIAKSITTEKKQAKARRAKAPKVETKEQREFRLKKEKLERFSKNRELEAKHTLAELKRREEILDAKHAAFDAKAAGLLAVDQYRKDRLPVALGSPASQKIGAIRTRQIYEKAKSDIITERAKAFQELAKVAKTRAEARQFLGQAAELQARAETSKSAEKRAVATDKKRALESFEAKTAVKVPSLSAITSPVRSLGQMVETGKVTAEKKKKEKELREEATKRGLPAQTPIGDIVSSDKEIRLEREKAKNQRKLEKMKAKSDLKELKANISVLKAQLSANRQALHTLESERKSGKENKPLINELVTKIEQLESMLTESQTVEKQLSALIKNLPAEKEGVRNPAYN